MVNENMFMPQNLAAAVAIACFLRYNTSVTPWGVLWRSRMARKEGGRGMLWLIPGIAAALYLFLIAPGAHARKRGAAIPRVPYAHRGLHGPGVPENSLAAFRRAAERGYGIEMDVRLTRDGHLAVIHDPDLTRMCGVEGRIADMTASRLRACRLAGTEETVPFLEEALEAVAAYRPPLIVELKSDGGDWRALPGRALEAMGGYPGFWCVESFDPRMIREIKKRAPHVVRGQLAFDPRQAGEKRREIRYALGAHLMMDFLGRPDFIAYRHDTDGNISFRVLRRLFHPVLIAWTVRSPEDFKKLRLFYDVQIFEGFEP